MDQLIEPEYTHLLYKGKYDFMADLLLYLFGFSCSAHVELETDLVKQEVSRAVILSRTK